MKTDTELQRNVLEELHWDPSFDAAEIGISAKDGIITLSGQVANFAEKSAAVRAAKRVSGVKAVADNIEVRLPGISERTDADIARAAVNILERPRSKRRSGATRCSTRSESRWRRMVGK